MLSLYEDDMRKLSFLWYTDVHAGNYDICGYSLTRLPFGLRCSSFLLSLSLYKMLIIDAMNDEASLKALKMQIYHLLYVDNGGMAFNSTTELKNG